MFLPLVTLCLLAVWPFVSFLNNNRDDALTYGPSISIYALVVLALVLALFLVGRWLLGAARQAQVAHVLGVATVATFLYLPLSALLSALGISLGTVRIAIWLVATLVVLLGVWRVSRYRQTGQVLAVIAAVIVAIPALGMVMFLISDKSPERTATVIASPDGGSARARPNVYWFILDGYARADVLADYFGFDNKPFLEELKASGFRVSDRAWANYASTKLSISTTASMEYYLPANTPLHPSMWTARLQGFNPVVERFKAMGYRYVHVEPGGNNLKTRCGGREDLCITADPVGALSVNEADVGLLQLTPVFPIIRRIFPRFLSFDFTTIDDVESKLNLAPADSQFVFAHILSPHPPQRFDQSCGRIENIEFDLAGEDYSAVLNGYINDLRCLNPEIMGLVGDILESDNDPVIILQSDHGLRADLSAVLPGISPSVPPELVPYANLNAIRLPRDCANPVDDVFSPVNTFRIVFACIDQAAPELLPNRSFGSQRSGLIEIEIATPSGG